MKNIWDERYACSEYIYGETPNQFFSEIIKNIEPGDILLPAEGEGRNSVHVAQLSWNAYACDQSIEAQKKAIALAKKNNVVINYKIGGPEQFFGKKFDCIALIYAHFDQLVRRFNHRKFADLLVPKGFIMLEAFSKEQINYNSGGPTDIDMLYSVDELAKDFNFLADIEIWQEEVELAEGTRHVGKASVIRLLGYL